IIGWCPVSPSGGTPPAARCRRRLGLQAEPSPPGRLSVLEVAPHARFDQRTAPRRLNGATARHLPVDPSPHRAAWPCLLPDRPLPLPARGLHRRDGRPELEVVPAAGRA